MTGAVISVLDAEAVRSIIAEELDRRIAPVLAALSTPREDSERDADAALLTRAELARRLGVNARTLRRMVLEGDLPAPVRVGKRMVRWRAVEIESYLDSRERVA